MQDILTEIQTLRFGRMPSIDRRNTSRYCVIVYEEDGSKTAYCFGVPLYDRESRRLVDLRFRKTEAGVEANGSNVHITVADTLTLQNREGECRITLPGRCEEIEERRLTFPGMHMHPTLNGVVCRAAGGCRFRLTAPRPFMDVRANDKAFSLMQSGFQPFVTVSVIGTTNQRGEVTAPAALFYEKLTESDYQLTLTPAEADGGVLAEINLYEPKLFQDTTVESRNPGVNNAFGSAAFIGRTPSYGEQWLYMRLDTTGIASLLDRPLSHAALYFPRHDTGAVPLTAFRVSARFCSFGSNWSNKIDSSERLTESTLRPGYHRLDVTGLIVDSSSGQLTESEGLILRTKGAANAFSAVSTGDSHYAPPILEVHFR